MRRRRRRHANDPGDRLPAGAVHPLAAAARPGRRPRRRRVAEAR
jgi:hypothetical protein